MGNLDRSTGVETPEDDHPRDRPPPPSPPEQPGSGLPSRAETHKAAAELNTDNDPQPTTDKPDASQRPTDKSPEEQDSKATQDTIESPAAPESVDTERKSLAAEGNAPEEQSTAEGIDTSADERRQNSPPAPFDGPASTEPPSKVGEDTADIDGGQAPADVGAETVDTRPTTEQGIPSKSPSTELGAAVEGNTKASGHPAEETTDSSPEQPEHAASLSGSPAALTDANVRPTDQENEAQQQVDDTAEIPIPMQNAEDDTPFTDAAQPDTDEQPADDAPLIPEIGQLEAHDSAEGTGNGSPGTTEVDKGGKHSGLRLMVNEKTVREHIDPIGTGAERQVPQGDKEPLFRGIREKDAEWTDGVDRLDELPTGEELLEDGDKASRAERARREAFRQSDKAADAVKKHVIIGRGAFEKPPAGHPEVKVCPLVPSPLEYLPVHKGAAVEDVVSNLLVLGILASAGNRLGRAGRKKER